MRRRRPVTTNVVFMPFPEVDDEFWSRYPSTATGELHPRVRALCDRSWSWLHRVVRPSLGPVEFKLSAAVLCMTVWSCQSRHTATYREIQEFLQVNWGFAVGREALRSAVRSLADIGLLVVHGIGQNGVTLSLNLDWTFEDIAAAHMRWREL
jgi:hypothetical protein